MLFLGLGFSLTPLSLAIFKDWGRIGKGLFCDLPDRRLKNRMQNKNTILIGR